MLERRDTFGQDNSGGTDGGYIIEAGSMIPIERFKEALQIPNKIALDVIKVQVKDHFEAL